MTAEILYNKGDVGREGIVQFVQCAATLLSDPSNYVREAALVAFDELANFLTPFDQENEIVPVITDLLGSEDRMDRVCGLLLLVSLIERGTALGGEAHLVNWLSQLLCDDDAEVRQVRSSVLPKMMIICSVYGQELASLYPAFLKALLNDTILKTALPHFRFLVKDKVCSIRKAAAESLNGLLEAVSDMKELKEAQSLVVEFYTILASDTTALVRLAAQRSFGEILAHLDASLVTKDMVLTFVNCAKKSADEPAKLMIGSCAQAFTAVAGKLGSCYWDQLKDLFVTLTQCTDDEVLTSIACSLHELASLLPPDIFRQDVFPFFSKSDCRLSMTAAVDRRLLCRMVHGGSLPVRFGIVQNFASLLSSLRIELQELCLFHMEHLCQSELMSCHQNQQPQHPRNHLGKHHYVTFFTKGWRLRASLAQQLSQVASSIPSNLICEYILPHAFHLCEDSVACVRLTAAEQLVQLIAEQQEKQTSSIIVMQLQKWLQSGNYKTRCVTALICQKTKHHRLPPDVRDQLDQIIDKLKSDPVKDVRRFFE